MTDPYDTLTQYLCFIQNDRGRTYRECARFYVYADGDVIYNVTIAGPRG